jgi:hypothetical protein
MKRLIALGASNLTRGFHTVVSTARTTWGPDIEFFAALGHGRSYGTMSSIPFRALPGILDCGLWSAIRGQPPAPTRALVTDVGNDILYGFPADRILAWVETAVTRLRDVTGDIVITDLPVDRIQRLSPAEFLLFRSVFAPRCRLPLDVVADRAATISRGLESLAATHRLRFVPLEADWYGFDPIHIRPSRWRGAWRAILGVPAAGRDDRSWIEGVRLYFHAPERQWLFGSERIRAQDRGLRLPRGGRIRLY